MMDDHDKILCERLATTIDHGICKCHERHRIAALEAELARVKDELRQANNVRDVFAQAVVQTATGEYEELAKWKKEAHLLADKLMERDAECVAEYERRKATKTALQAGRDVMAVIHGDGGHYREAHGDRKAADDAINIIIKLRVDLDEEHSRRKAAEAILRNQLDYGYFRENVHAYFARYKEE